MGELQRCLDTHPFNRVDGIADDVFDRAATHKLRQVRKGIR